MVEIDEKQAFSIVQKAKETGSLRIGVNEVTKAIERGQAKAVFYANDVSPAEIVAHIDGLCKEMNILSAQIGSKAELGAAAQIKSTTAIAVIDAGSAKKEIEALTKEVKAPAKEEVVEETPAKEEAVEETPAKEEAVEAKEE